MTHELTVREAVELLGEYDELKSIAQTDADHEYVQTEFEAAPNGREALAIRRALSGLAYGLAVWQQGYEQKSQNIAGNTGNMIRPDLELVDSGHEADAYEARQSDILLAHTLSDHYAKRLKKVDNDPTRKQAKGISRDTLKELGDTAVLIENPDRLQTIYESLLADTEHTTNNSLVQLMAEEISKRVEQEADMYSPDTIAEWLKAASRESLAQRQLQATLLGGFFRSVEGETSERVVDMHELFLRGIVRTFNRPDAMKLGLDLMNQDTASSREYEHIIRNNSMFHRSLGMIRATWMHKPEVLGRVSTNMRLQIELEDRISASIHQFKSELDTPANQDDIIQRASLGQLNAEERMILSGARGAMANIGQVEFDNRIRLLESVVKEAKSLRNNPDILNDAAQRIVGSGGQKRTEDMILDIVMNRYPGQKDFIRQFFNTKTQLGEDVDTYISDVYGSVGASNIQIANQELGIDFNRLLEYTEIDASQVHEATIPIGDGYVVVGKVYDNQSLESLKERIELLNPEQIEQAKARLHQRSGSGKRKEAITDQDNSFLGLMLRRETLEDLSKEHPVNVILPMFSIDQGLDNRETIVQIEANIIQNKRRFMNGRGIRTEFLLPKGEQLSLVIKKHGNNPQAFIVQAEVAGVGTGRYVIDPSLAPYVGDKTIRDRVALEYLHEYSLRLLRAFMCQEVVETEEGELGDGKNALTTRIAHLRLLPDGQSYSYDAWKKCLEEEGYDLEVLSHSRGAKLETTRKSTYVSAIESDDETKTPLFVYIAQD